MRRKSMWMFLFIKLWIDIVYKTEEYFQNLRLEWENSIKTKKLEERNCSLLKRL